MTGTLWVFEFSIQTLVMLKLRLIVDGERLGAVLNGKLVDGAVERSGMDTISGICCGEQVTTSTV